ncbi:MAG TPA: hypothetical protein VFE53_25785 [Mucilaginibacter sp.]|jgi:hypothetical protein|nr:hypothetical protein [Mucilaginibacter sp.]
MANETITNIANTALTVSVIVALIFGIAQVKSAKRDRRERLTLEVLRQFQTREFVELIFFITDSDVPRSREELMKLPHNERLLLVQFGQQMESLGMLVAEGLINIDLVDKTLGSFVTTAWEKSKDMFMDIRINAPDPFLGEYYQWLAEGIDRRMQCNPRKPFHETRKRGK